VKGNATAGGKAASKRSIWISMFMSGSAADGDAT
jgi:hypothetical protein